MKNHQSIKTKKNLKKNEISFLLKTDIYPKYIIYKACYTFIDRVYIYLDKHTKEDIKVTLKGKNKLKDKDIDSLKGLFLNELLNVILRENITKRNKKILEYIVGGAINASLENNKLVELENKSKDQLDKKESEEDINVEKEIAILKKELEKMEEEDFENDSLGIKEVC